MDKQRSHRRRAVVSGQRLLSGVALGALLAVGGCSSVPDALNPAEWYKGTVDFFAGEDEPATAQGSSAGSTESSETTASAPPPSEQPRGGLVADVEGRKYAEQVRRQGEAVARLEEEPEVAAAPPAPKPMPVVPVESAPRAVMQPMTQPMTAPEPEIAAAPPSSTNALAEEMARSQQDYEDRRRALAERLNAIQPPANAPSLPPANAMAPTRAEFETVVVDANGVSFEGGVAQAAQQVSAEPSSFDLGQADSGAGAPGVRLATIRFPNGSAKLSRLDRDILGSVKQIWQQQGGQLHVVGHASSRTRNMDPIKHKMVNYQVSVARADQVAKELVDMGVKAELVVVDARSDADPIYYEVMPSGEAGNRRAEIYLVR